MFDPDRRTLGELYQNPIRGEMASYFVVPRFQRKYEWEKEQEVSRLIDDVFENLGSSYFMGPVIFCRDADSDEACLEVVDGQQRLVTFSIFIRAMVDYMQKRMKEGAFSQKLGDEANQLKHDIKALIVQGKLKGLAKERPVLRLSSVINPVFKDDLILNEDENKIEKMRKPIKGEHPSTRRLRYAYAKIFDSIGKECDELYGDALLNKLNLISNTIMNGQLFLQITVQKESDAYTIFETINERGRRLNVSDLIKNLCFRKLASLEESDLDQLEEEWDKAECGVGNFGSFIWHLWISMNGSCPKNKLFGLYEKMIKKMDENAVWDFIHNHILEEELWYHQYEESLELPGDNDVVRIRKNYFQMLDSMSATRCYPLLLSIDFGEKRLKTIKPNEANELFKAVACLTFWHSGVCGNDAKKLESVYHEIAKNLRQKEISVDGVMKKLCAQFPSVAECKSSFITKTFDNDNFIKMMLRNMEMFVDKKNEKSLKSNTSVWLEHILPQNPDKKSPWIKTFPDEKERRDYSQKLGNCTLLFGDANRDIGAKPFEEKVKKYVESGIVLTKAVAENYKNWDKKSIDARTKELFDMAQQVWPIYKA
jgi:hypothetical protein